MRWRRRLSCALDRSEWPATHMVRISEYAEALAVMQGGLPGMPERRVRAWSLGILQSGGAPAR